MKRTELLSKEQMSYLSWLWLQYELITVMNEMEPMERYMFHSITALLLVLVLFASGYSLCNFLLK